jgi:hypothetical protein
LPGNKTGGQWTAYDDSVFAIPQQEHSAWSEIHLLEKRVFQRDDHDADGIELRNVVQMPSYRHNCAALAPRNGYEEGF